MSFGNSYEVWLDRGLWYWQIITGTGTTYFNKWGFNQRANAEAEMQQQKETLEGVAS